MVMTAREVLNYLKKISKNTASLIDESNPNGLVQIKDSNMNVMFVISRESYDSLMECKYNVN